MITFLGTGASKGIPYLGCSCKVCHSQNIKDKRLRSSVHISIEGLSILIDAGMDLRQQLLRESITHVDTILLTHEHKDHMDGIDELKGILEKQQKDIAVYSNAQTNQQLRYEYDYYLQKSTKLKSKLNLHTITNQPLSINALPIIPIEVMHGSLPILGYRIHNFAYITDASMIVNQEIEKLKGIKILIVNALQKALRRTHFSLTEAIQLAQKINAPTTFLTHISHNMGLYNEITAELPPNIFLAFDGLKITL